jgi:hypothetical protein
MYRLTDASRLLLLQVQRQVLGATFFIVLSSLIPPTNPEDLVKRFNRFRFGDSPCTYLYPEVSTHCSTYASRCVFYLWIKSRKGIIILKISWTDCHVLRYILALEGYEGIKNINEVVWNVTTRLKHRRSYMAITMNT